MVKDPILWRWYQAGLSQSLGARRDGAILLLGPSGDLAMTWTFKGGLAAKWIGPSFNAMDNAIALEGLEIAHQGLSLDVAGGTIDVGAIIDTVAGFFD